MALLIWLPGVAAGQDLPQDWMIERVEQYRPLGDARFVEIRNRSGDIRTRAAKDDTVSVVSVIQRHRDDPERPQILMHEAQARLIVEVDYPSHEAGASLPEGAGRRRVDVAVFVPENVSLSIETLHGRSESKGHKGPLDVKTATGKIIVLTQDTVQARSERGSIQVTFKNRQWTGSSHLETVTGNIDIFLIEHPDVLARINTAGNITTDYSIDIQSSPGSSRKQAQARIGAASHILELLSAKGSVRLGRIFDLIPTHSSPRESTPADASAPARSP